MVETYIGESEVELPSICLSYSNLKNSYLYTTKVVLCSFALDYTLPVVIGKHMASTALPMDLILTFEERMKDLLIIYLAGMTGIFKAIPVGIMLQASPVWIALMTAFGGLTAAAVLYHFGGWMQQMMKKKAIGLEKREERTRRMYSKYGIIGLGIFGTLLLGLHITIILGLIVVKAKKKLLVWTTVGILLWSSVITAAAASGFELFEKIIIFR